jgi:hypothetical protein
METDIATNPAEAVSDTPAEVAHEAPELETEHVETEGEGAEHAPPEDDGEEVDYEGRKYRVPKELKDAFLRQSDYTRKTQEIAEQRRTLEAAQAQAAQHAQALQDDFQGRVQLHVLDQQLEQYAKISEAEWAQLWNTEPQRAGALTSQYQRLQAQRQTLVGELQQKAQARAFHTQRETAKRMEEAAAVLKRDIPEWSPELATKTRDFLVKDMGIDAALVGQIDNPAFVRVAHLARLGAEWQANQRKAARQATTPQANPVPKVTAQRSAPSTNLYTEKNPDKWLAMREAQLAKQQGRR